MQIDERNIDRQCKEIAGKLWDRHPNNPENKELARLHGDHPKHSISKWRGEVQRGATDMEYIDWRADRLWCESAAGRAAKNHCELCGADLDSPSSAGAEDGVCGECIDGELRA